MKRILLCCLLSLASLWASDLLVLSDGSMHIGTVLSYETGKPLVFEDLKGKQTSYESSSVLLTRTNANLENLIDPGWDRIVYHPRQKGGAYELPPRYTFRGQRYTVDPLWGRESEILEFFDFLKSEPLDEKTHMLIAQLETLMEKQNGRIQCGFATELAGLTLMLVPFFLMDDSTDSPTIPTWAAWTGIAGIGINVAGLGMLVRELFISYDPYLQGIADSYNSHADALL